jgi:endonuclease/exonuclease/phosphatase family metal-dependent hydrolase
MVRPSYCGLRRSVIVVACLVFAAAALTGSLARTAGAAAPGPLQVLQMNLCDSGIAECYTGRSVAEAAAVIRTDAPDVVTLNEVCRDDVYALDQALVRVEGAGTVVWAFKAAADRSTGGAFHCRNGQPYGIGLLVRMPPSSRGYTTYSGIYPTQDRSDPEERAWLCLYAIGDFYACTTHLANNNPTIAFAQCGYLLDTAIPAVRARAGGYEPTVLGGDFNLAYRSPDVRSCLPSGYLREGDGGVQYVVATTDFTASSDRSIGMGGTTDHPGLLVALAAGGIDAP